MKNKKLVTILLAGTIIGATAQNTLAQKRKNQDKQILGISGVEYKNKEPDSEFLVEIQKPFGKTIWKGDEFIYANNLHTDLGELNYVMYKIDKAKNGAEIVVGGPKTYIKGKQYIPTLAVDSNYYIFNKFEIYDLDEKKMSQLKRKRKKADRKSKSDFGYNYWISNEDIKKILLGEKVNGQEYVYWFLTKGKLTSPNNQRLNLEEGMIDQVIMPLEDLCEGDGFGINLDNEKVTLYRKCGFYIAVTEEFQNTGKVIGCEEQFQNSKPKTPETTSSKDEKENCIYITKPKDTYWKIADEKCKDGKRAGELQKLNPKIPETKIPIGAEINIPCDCK